MHGTIVEQRVGQGLFSRFYGSVFAFGFAGAHDGFAFVFHNAFDVGKIEVNQARHHHQIGNGTDAGVQNVVGHDESVGKRGVFIGNTEQVLVRNNDDAVDLFGKLFDGGFGRFETFAAFELERFGNDADGQNAFGFGQLGNDRCGTRTGTAAHAGGNKDHIGAFKFFFYFFLGFFGGQLTDFRTGSGAETLCGFKAELDFAAGRGMSESLRVGIGNDKVNAFQILRNHIIDGIAAAAADTDDGNPRFQVHNSFFRYG